MKESNIKLSFNELTGSYQIMHKNFVWQNDGRKPYVIIRKKVGGKYLSTYRPLMSALKKHTEYSGNKIVTTYGGFFAFGKSFDFKLICTAEIIGEDEVSFSIKAENESDADIQAIYFPAPFNSKKKGKLSYHIDAMRQGFILPDGYKKNVISTFAYANYLRKINTGDCYMPIWGRVCDGHGFCAIVETPYDACMFSSFGRHSAFVNSVHWMSSLGKLSYERKIRFIFHEKCDYNTVAKDYRNYLIARDELLSIDDKIKENPNIKKLIGSPVLHHRIYTNIQPESKFYKKNGTNSVLYGSFYKRAEQLEHIKELGLEKLYIHTDGWGKNGYDNDHPYILPPCEVAGGYDGMKAMADKCKELGFVFALHDQYRDFYYSSPGFDIEKAVRKINGKHPYCSTWDGGAHTWLCASQALAYVQKTYGELEQHGVDVQGVYLDVFAVMQGDECFHPEHKITREQSIKHRAGCFDYLNKKGIIMSSEEPAMQLLNNIALVHHGPHTTRPLENGSAMGIPVPLANLVFHDCVMIPLSRWNNWGTPKGESVLAHCALNAGVPYFQPFSEDDVIIDNKQMKGDFELLSDDKLKAEIDLIKPICDIQARLYNVEMVKHQFADNNLKIQKITYFDGTVITADVEKGTYSVKWGNENA